MAELDKHDTPLPTTTIKWRFPSIHPEGRKYVVGAAFITLLAYFGVNHFIGWLLVGVTIWVATFFRDPVRTTPRGDKLIVAHLTPMPCCLIALAASTVTWSSVASRFSIDRS